MTSSACEIYVPIYVRLRALYVNTYMRCPHIMSLATSVDNVEYIGKYSVVLVSSKATSFRLRFLFLLIILNGERISIRDYHIYNTL